MNRGPKRSAASPLRSLAYVQRGRRLPRSVSDAGACLRTVPLAAAVAKLLAVPVAALATALAMLLAPPISAAVATSVAMLLTPSISPAAATAVDGLLAPPAAAASTPQARVRPAMVDAFGDTLAAGPCPQRIVSLSPSLTEILFAVGVDSSRVAGVTRFCDYPPAAQRRPIVGGIVDPSPELIISQRPDLVLAVRGNPRPILGQLGRLGLPVFAFEDRTGLRGVGALMEAVASVACPDDSVRADSVVASFREILNAYEAWSAVIPAAERPTVYYADPEYPTWTAGAGSHIDDLVRLAGGANLAGDLPGWPQMSLEQIILDQPRFLLLALPEGQAVETAYDDLMSMPGWSALAALKDRRICWIRAARLQRPGPRLVGVLAELASSLHSKRPRPDVEGEIAPERLGEAP